MSNTLGLYDPLFYAQEALIWLQKSLGLAGRVYRGYDPTPQQEGSIIKIRRPMTFTAATMPASTTDLLPESVSVTLDQWKGVTFALTDQELAYTKEKVINEHIAPAAYAVADAMDTSVAALYKDVPWYATTTSPLAVADITGLKKQLAINKAPQNDGRMHLMLSPTLEEEALRNSAFAQWQGSGNTGEQTQITGSLGQRYGFETFMSQNIQTHTAGTSADATGALTANAAKGATTISFDSITTSGTIKAGDTFVIAGNTQRYAFTADYTASSGAVSSAAITPPLVQAYTSGDVITINLVSGDQSLAFHRDAFCLAVGVLPMSANELGAKVESVVDRASGLSIRARMWYDGTNAKTYVGLDALWGVKTLNGNLAVRLVD